jgi:FtsH-binding integral membrane protein
MVHSLLSAGFAAIYMIYILVDTQLIIGGKNKRLSLDNYIMGTIILYTDIIGLFLKILDLLGEKKKRKE